MFSSGNQHAKRCQGKPNMIDQDFHPQWIVRSFKEAITRGGDTSIWVYVSRSAFLVNKRSHTHNY